MLQMSHLFPRRIQWHIDSHIEYWYRWGSESVGLLAARELRAVEELQAAQGASPIIYCVIALSGYD